MLRRSLELRDRRDATLPESSHNQVRHRSDQGSNVGWRDGRGFYDKENVMEMAESDNASGNVQEVDPSTFDRIIAQALDLSSATSRLLRAWHSGAVDAQESMERLWESFNEVRSSYQ
jgi:hypothetical protein